MAIHDSYDTDESTIPAALRRFIKNRLFELGGLTLLSVIIVFAISMASWSVNDPSFNHATGLRPSNVFGSYGAIVSDQLIQFLGLGSLVFIFVPLKWVANLLRHEPISNSKTTFAFWIAATIASCCLLADLHKPSGWALTSGMGGSSGEIIVGGLLSLLSIGIKGIIAELLVFMASVTAFLWLLPRALDTSFSELTGGASALFKNAKPKAAAKNKRRNQAIVKPSFWVRFSAWFAWPAFAKPPVISGEAEAQDILSKFRPLSLRRPLLDERSVEDEFSANDREDVSDELAFEDEEPADEQIEIKSTLKTAPRTKPKTTQRKFELPSLDYLAEPKKVGRLPELSKEQLEKNARQLEGVLDDFGVKGQIINVRPGPVVTLYELEPAPGIKSSRVISLADDIARSMSAVSARVAVVSGRNAIGIELPNSKRETVYLRELFQGDSFIKNNTNLTLALGKNIGGEPIYADLARMPHLLIAGTTGSGKSVGINTMILSLLYRLPPDKCKLIMIDPKMLELSVYEGIPHLLTPVVTDPRKAVVALKWAVREMEDRYKKMSKTGVRNVDGYNMKIAQMAAKGDKFSRTVQTGFNAETGEPIFEQEQLDLTPMPYIVVIIDEMADLMMVAGKDIEGAVQRLAQMARAAGIHVVMATQRPSVDVITGTIKANFPTRISFQVTSKIDSRTILGEQGAEQLLGQGDMLYMAGGGRISRLHAPFVTDGEVEAIVNHLKAQGAPEYLEAVTEEDDENGGGESSMSAGAESGSGDDLYDQAVQVVLRDKKVSTSYVQRRLGVGYNKAATLIERMEQEGVISSPNSQGKREILVPGDSARL